MTTIDELCAVIEGLGIQWTNADWERADDMAPPFVVLRKSGAESPGANDLTWCVVSEYDVELYTVHRNYPLERALATALDSAGIYYYDGGTWPLQTEGLIETVFTVSVREN